VGFTVHWKVGDLGVGRETRTKRHRVRRILLWVVALVLLSLCRSSVAPWVYEPASNLAVRSISHRIHYPWEYVRAVWDHLVHGESEYAEACEDFTRLRPVEESGPVSYVPAPRHPYMASNQTNNMHCDAYMTDTYATAGPVGRNLRVNSRTQGFGGYGTVTVDRQGRLVAVFSNGRGFQLELLDPYSLEELASHDLPSRPWYWILQGIMPWEYIGAGMYFYLDHLDRAIVPTTENTIQVIRTPTDDTSFDLIREYDLSDHVVPMRWPHRDSVAWVLPDWSGDYYWFATTGGMVGTVDASTGVVQTLRLEGEIIENSFAVTEEGVYILSDHALYRFSQDGTGEVRVDWRTEYDRGPAKKPGHITRGSGTSVSLVGGADGLAIITDNAEPRIHLVFVDRRDGDVVCSEPLFAEGRSGTDISVACFEHADDTGQGTGRVSAVVENNWGHHTFPHSRPESGLTRVDAARHEDGSYTCDTVWTNDVKGICVFKLSLGSGLVYTYWRDEDCPLTAWVLTAVDVATGRTAYTKLVGTGLGYNNWAGALFIHPEDGALYSTTIFGLVRIQDTGDNGTPLQSP